jgi:prepilin-type N-terminal cleavage/methylation domain-containing protein
VKPPRGAVRRGDQAGFSLVEIAVVLVVLAIVGSILYAYLGSTSKTLEQVREERPLAQARLAADRATVSSIRASLQLFYTQNGQWPPSKEAVAALLNPPPNFQCAGNDYTYDPATGQVALVNDDSARC